MEPCKHKLAIAGISVFSLASDSDRHGGGSTSDETGRDIVVCELCGLIFQRNIYMQHLIRKGEKKVLIHDHLSSKEEKEASKREIFGTLDALCVEINRCLSRYRYRKILKEDIEVTPYRKIYNGCSSSNEYIIYIRGYGVFGFSDNIFYDD